MTENQQFFYQKFLKFRRFFLGFLGQIFGVLTFFSDNLSKIKYYDVNFLKIGQKLNILSFFQKCVSFRHIFGRGGGGLWTKFIRVTMFIFSFYEFLSPLRQKNIFSYIQYKTSFKKIMDFKFFARQVAELLEFSFFFNCGCEFLA